MDISESVKPVVKSMAGDAALCSNRFQFSPPFSRRPWERIKKGWSFQEYFSIYWKRNNPRNIYWLYRIMQMWYTWICPCHFQPYVMEINKYYRIGLVLHVLQQQVSHHRKATGRERNYLDGFGCCTTWTESYATWTKYTTLPPWKLESSLDLDRMKDCRRNGDSLFFLNSELVLILAGTCWWLMRLKFQNGAPVGFGVGAMGKKQRNAYKWRVPACTWMHRTDSSVSAQDIRSALGKGWPVRPGWWGQTKADETKDDELAERRFVASVMFPNEKGTSMIRMYSILNYWHESQDWSESCLHKAPNITLR